MKQIVAALALWLSAVATFAQAPVSKQNVTILTDAQKLQVTKLQLRAMRMRQEYDAAESALSGQLDQLERTFCGKDMKLVEQSGDLRCELKPQSASALPDPSGHARLTPEEKKK